MTTYTETELLFGVHPDEFWMDGAVRAVEAMAATGRTFQMWDVADEFGLPDPPHPNHWGALASKLRKAGVIRPVGAEPSKRPSVAGSLTRVWIGAR